MSRKDSRAARVLILEDDPSLREILEDVLSARGLDVSVAANGEEALTLARAHPFDLIVADIRMKGISGLDAIEQARELQPDLASIVVSGYATEQETLRAVQLNVAGYLKKPFKIPKLLELVNTLVDQRQIRKQAEEELRELRKSVLWFLNRQINLAERVSPGDIDGPARLAYGLAKTKGLSPGLCDQVYSGTGLAASIKMDESQLPTPVIRSLKPFATLLACMEGDELADFALTVGSLAPDEVFNRSEFEKTYSAEILDLYKQYQENGQCSTPRSTQVNEEIVETENLFSVSANLERLGDLEGANNILESIIGSGEMSARLIRAHLAKVRLAIQRGKAKPMEHHVKEALAVAAALGPSTLANVQWKLADTLRSVGHPAAVRLYFRAAANLELLGQFLPWSCCILALTSLDQKLESTQLETALDCLDDPENSSEIAELVGKFLPDLFFLGGRRRDERSLSLCRRFVKGFYFDLGPLFLTEAHPSEARHLALELLEQSGLGLSDDWLDALTQGEDPKLSSRAEALGGRCQSGSLGIRASCFGSFTVTLGRRELTEKDWKTQKTKYLFARLLRTGSRTINVERIVEEFWPNKPQTSRSSLNTSVSTLRRVFRDAAPTGQEVVQRVGETLCLNPNVKIWSDEQLFNEAIKQAERFWERGEAERAMSTYSRVIRLYEGSYLDGCYLDWALSRRSTYERQVELALFRLMEHRFSQHRYQESHEHAKDLLKYQPDDTRVHEIVMLSLIGMDRHQSAMAHYDTYSEQLRIHYGSEPTLELLKVFQMAKYGFRQESGLSDL